MRGPSSLTLPSFAKINWVLKVLGRRPDGFHEIRTILQTVDLHDWIRFEKAAGPELELQITGKTVAAGAANLVIRAASLLQKRGRVRSGVRIRLDKRIPVGAGMGGGSSNAAMTLLGLNRIWECEMSREELAHLGANLGSDVPFFLFGGTCQAGGRGERPDPITDPPEQLLLLVYPNLEISTKRAYAAGSWPDLERLGELTIQEADTKIQRFREAASKGSFLSGLLDNDFDSPMQGEYPVLAETAHLMLQAGCERVVLCGSGSTLLGLANTRLAEIASAVKRQKAGEVYLCRSISRSRYESRLRQAGISLT